MAVVSAFAIAVAVVAVMLFRRRRPAAALGVTGVGMMGLMTLMHLLLLPRAEFLKLSVRAAEVLSREGATAPGRAVMLDYKEPSLAFYQGVPSASTSDDRHRRVLASAPRGCDHQRSGENRLKTRATAWRSATFKGSHRGGDARGGAWF